MRATSNLKHQSSNIKEEVSNSRTPDFYHQASSGGLPFQKISSVGTPRPGPPIRVSASPRRDRGPQVHARGGSTLGERRRFLEFGTILSPFVTRLKHSQEYEIPTHPWSCAQRFGQNTGTRPKTPKCRVDGVSHVEFRAPGWAREWVGEVLPGFEPGPRSGLVQSNSLLGLHGALPSANRGGLTEPEAAGASY